MDSKRNGSGPPPPPQRSGSFQWDEPPSRGKSPDPASRPDFRFTDDDDDAQGAPEEEEALLEEVDEPDFVDSALVQEVKPAHGGPPPAPAPMPRGRERGAFLDDGEIALPPGLSQVVRTQSGSSFPFRDVTDDDDDVSALSGKFASDDDDAPSARDFADDMPPDGEADETWADAPAPTTINQRAEDDFGDVLEPSRLIAAKPAPAPPRRDEDDFGDVLEPSRLTPVRAAARPARDEDDFGDVLEPSRLTPVRAAEPAPAPRPARDEDDFGDVLEPSRAMPAARARQPEPEPEPEPQYIDLRDSQSLNPPRPRDENLGIRDSQSLVHDALDRSGLAPADDAELGDLGDDAPLPPPPPAALDLDGAPPPPLLAASAAQSGVGFSRAELERSYERLPIVRPPATAEPTARFTGPEGHGPRASTGERAPTGGAMGPLSDRDDADAPTPGLAPLPSEPLGEPFPLDLWSDPDELIGRDLGRYRLVKPLSRGQTSRVYAAIDEESGRHVAIRILGPTHSPAEPRARQFLYEAQQLAKLHHESIAEVLDTGSTGDHLTYYVMERVEGESLAAVARNEGPLPWQQVGIITTQICEALIVAADRNLHATDLNLGAVIRLKGEGEDNRGRQPLKLLGVGISPVASVYRSPDGNLAESKGTPPGTAEYMAPEVASGGFPEPASVVYALGVMMYELLTGKPPFRGESFLAVIKKQMYDEPTPPSVVVPQQEIAGPFEAVLMQALAKDPSLRFPTVRDLHEAVLAARAQEGELRRATAVLSLDPAFWDERSTRKSEPHPAPPPQPEPQPLASFASDLRSKNPALAEAVLGPTSAAKSEPVPAPRAAAVSEPRAIPIPAPLQDPPPQPAAPAKPPKPEPSMILSQLAPPLRAPEPVALPTQAAAPMPLIVLAQPPAPASNTFVRNISLTIVAVSAVIALFFSMSGGPTPAPRKTDQAAEGSGKRTKEISKPRKQRDTRPRDEEPAAPIVVAVQPVPETRPTPTPETKIEPPPPETKIEPPPPETKVAPTLVPETKAEPTPPPETKAEPTPPPETKTAPPPETKTAPPPETKTAEPKPKPKPKSNVDPSLPQRIEPIRLKSRYASMEPRIAARCASMSGLGTASGLKVNVKIVVDTQGNVKATAQGNWAGTPLGRCVEDFVESIRFNETQHGGSRLHTFTF